MTTAVVIPLTNILYQCINFLVLMINIHFEQNIQVWRETSFCLTACNIKTLIIDTRFQVMLTLLNVILHVLTDIFVIAMQLDPQEQYIAIIFVIFITKIQKKR